MTHSLSAWLQNIKTDDIDGGLAADFDGSLSGLGVELGSSTYNMSEALLALPVFKQESLETGFQYILSAATSPATKMNEETLTYLNQGQSYEVKLKKFGDLSELRGRLLRSVIRVVFHERRLQYMEKEQLDTWRQQRPGERILDIDVPLSYAVSDVKVDVYQLNAIEFSWDPNKDTGAYIKVNCISTEFTAKKHGGEKGVPFRVQVETYLDEEDMAPRLLHCASCQIKVFKPKGADRKHKTDREKMDKRSDAEKEKFQPSYECTVLTEISLEQVQSYLQQQMQQELEQKDRLLTVNKPTPSAAVAMPGANTPPSPLPSPQASPSSSLPTQQQALRNFQCLAEAYNSASNESNSQESRPTPSKAKRGHSVPRSSKPKASYSRSARSSLDTSTLLPTQEEVREPELLPLSPTAVSDEVTDWLIANRFSSYVKVFQNFSGADLLRLTRDDLIQICGLADGIRLNNALQSKTVRPRLTLYVCQGSSSKRQSLPTSPPVLPPMSPISSYATPTSQPQLPPPPPPPPPPARPRESTRDHVFRLPHNSSMPCLTAHFNSAKSPPRTIKSEPMQQETIFELQDITDHNQNYTCNARKIVRPMVRRHSSPQFKMPPGPPLSLGEESQERALSRLWEELMEGVGGTAPSSLEGQQCLVAGVRKVLEAPPVISNGNTSPVGASPSSTASRSPTTPTIPHTPQHMGRSHSVPHVSTPLTPSSVSMLVTPSSISTLVTPSPPAVTPFKRLLVEDTDARSTLVSRSPASILASPSPSPASILATPSASHASILASPSPSPASILATPSASHASILASPSPSPAPMLATPSPSPAPMLATPSPSPASMVATPSPPTITPFKRQLVEDTDASDGEPVMTSSKKQRTRNLEMSRKEVYHAVYLDNLSVRTLGERVANLFSITGQQVLEIHMQGPSGIPVLVTDHVVQNIQDQSRFAVEAIQDDNIPDRYKLYFMSLESR